MDDRDKSHGERVINQADTDKAIVEFLEEIKIAKQN